MCTHIHVRMKISKGGCWVPQLFSTLFTQDRVSHSTWSLAFWSKARSQQAPRILYLYFQLQHCAGIKACLATLSCFIWVGTWLSEFKHLVGPSYHNLKGFHLFVFYKILSWKSLVYFKVFFFFHIGWEIEVKLNTKKWNITVKHLNIIMLIHLICKKIEISWFDHYILYTYYHILYHKFKQLK